MQTLTIMTSSIRRFLRDERGATAIEYAIMASGIALAVVATVMALGSSVNNLFTTVSSAYPG
ncbi:MAG TPA: Flp family type IVb pilin [Pseudorhodoplanes sp.]|jgi:pilus assembly protein Flp/PilA|nr:Flp family type IVb pilin [Pseudorhodoplanes sp.]